MSGGDEGDRTLYLLNAIQALSQVSYAPMRLAGFPTACLLYHVFSENASPFFNFFQIFSEPKAGRTIKCPQKHHRGGIPPHLMDGPEARGRPVKRPAPDGMTRSLPRNRGTPPVDRPNRRVPLKTA